MTDHWCKYCNGVNTHNCQFNPNLPRMKIYTTNTAAGPEASGPKPMTLVDVCMKDAEELREIAAHFDALGKKSNGDFLREVANRHEILAGAYRTSVARHEREMKEWIERERTEEEKAAALKWLEDMRGDSECRADEGEQQ